MKALETRWTKEVREHPDRVHMEYPRPSMVRGSYVNLNGMWDYAITNDKEKPEQYDGKILVPFSPEAPLSGVERQLKPGQLLWYRRILPSQVRGHQEEGDRSRWLLHFGAVDQFAAVYVNGKLVCRHLGGYLPFSADVTEALTDGENELVVIVRDFTDHSYYSRGKQKLERGGMFYTAQSGIWQTVWMEEVPEKYIERMKITPLYDERAVAVEIIAAGSADVTGDKRRVSIRIWSEETQAMEVEGSIGQVIRIPVPDMHPWSPEDPFLYSIRVQMEQDVVTGYFAMRKISVSKDRDGIPRVMLNNQRCFQKGVLDQGYWPDGLYTAPTDEALIFDIAEMKRLGFNMLRKHIKIEPERWYYHCDRLGMLVWQDMVCGGTGYHQWYVTYLATAIKRLNIRPGDWTYGLLSRRHEKGRQQFVAEMKETIRVLYNHSSIVTWVIFNEGWGQFDAERMTRIAREQDATRLIDQASGWFDQKGGDFLSIHEYFFSLKWKPEQRVAALTEFGGYSWNVPGHSMYEKVYGYRTFHGKQEITKGYEKLMENEILPNVRKGIDVLIYTQLSDIEEEVNGFYTYDREMLKIEEETIQRWNEVLTEAAERSS